MCCYPSYPGHGGSHSSIMCCYPSYPGHGGSHTPIMCCYPSYPLPLWITQPYHVLLSQLSEISWITLVLLDASIVLPGSGWHHCFYLHDLSYLHSCEPNHIPPGFLSLIIWTNTYKYTPVDLWGFHNSSSHYLVIDNINFCCYHTTIKVNWLWNTETTNDLLGMASLLCGIIIYVIYWAWTTYCVEWSYVIYWAWMTHCVEWSCVIYWAWLACCVEWSCVIYWSWTADCVEWSCVIYWAWLACCVEWSYVIYWEWLACCVA